MQWQPPRRTGALRRLLPQCLNGECSAIKADRSEPEPQVVDLLVVQRVTKLEDQPLARNSPQSLLGVSIEIRVADCGRLQTERGHSVGRHLIDPGVQVRRKDNKTPAREEMMLVSLILSLHQHPIKLWTQSCFERSNSGLVTPSQVV